MLMAGFLSIYRVPAPLSFRNPPGHAFPRLRRPERASASPSNPVRKPPDGKGTNRSVNTPCEFFVFGRPDVKFITTRCVRFSRFVAPDIDSSACALRGLFRKLCWGLDACESPPGVFPGQTSVPAFHDYYGVFWRNSVPKSSEITTTNAHS